VILCKLFVTQRDEPDPAGSEGECTISELSGLVSPRIDRIMQLARRHLEMDLVYISEFTDGRQVPRTIDGDGASFGLAVGDGLPLEDTYCRLMVDDAIPNVIPDSGADPRVRTLRTTVDGSIGAYVGVPLRLSDGTLYGSFCGLSHRQQPGLDRRDASFLRMLAELVVDDLEEQRQRDRRRAEITDLILGERVTIALQPVVDLHTGRCIGVEALSRFPTAAGSPETVFAAAHDVGLGLELERMTAARALALRSRIAADQALGINLTPAVAMVLADEDLGGPLTQLVLEITEHEAVDSYASLRDRLQPLRDRGLRLAIDDAGAGYASLQHIIELQPELIKIDRSIIDGLAKDKARRSVVSGFVLLALDLNGRVIAEGVERADDLQAAADLGVDAAQGYLIARPSTDPDDHAYWAGDPDLLSALRSPGAGH
jgi:EAL domain-containing protein (putative c-di-GMP-specific phosphodiesterase class I)